MPILHLDGTTGGGQILRSALTLSMVTGRPFRISGIRGGRKKPGLMRQHLTCVKAACVVSDGSADGAEIGSTELIFRPGKLRPGDYTFEIGTAGSTGLLLQTLLPALGFADGPSTLHLGGGTHNPLAPPFDFLERSYLHALRRMGVDAALTLHQAGFAPAGGGRIECAIRPCGKPAPLDLTDRGSVDPVATRIRVPFRNLPSGIAERVLAAAAKSLPCDDARIDRLPAGPGQGVACIIECEFPHTRELACTFGEMGVSAEKVGHRAARMMYNFLDTGVAAGHHLADQLLLPMALAGGGRFTTLTPDDHLRTNIHVIEAFLPVRIQVEKTTSPAWNVSCG